MNGFKISGATDSGYLGSAISAAGDLNGDGRDDLIVGAQGATLFLPFGASYVVYGSDAEIPRREGRSDLNGTDGFTLLGPMAAARPATR